MEWGWVVLGCVGLGGAAALLWRPLRGFGREIQVERARELFALQRERLQDQFFEAAATTGKPRGLRWKKCDFDDAIELARDRQTGQLLALTPVTIAFEAIEGGDMEGVAAVSNLRQATAVFVLVRGHWETNGRTVFNLNPAEALEHFKGQYEHLVEHPNPKNPNPKE